MNDFNLSQGQFKGLHKDLATQGGFTVHPGTGIPKTKGISVATETNELRLDRADTSPQKIAEYHSDSGNQERFGRGASLGGWRSEGGDDFIDTPTVYPETPGGHSRARNQMLKSHQIGSYNLSKGTTELNPFHPENQSMDIVSSDNSLDQQKAWKDMPRRVTKGKMIPLRGQSFS